MKKLISIITAFAVSAIYITSADTAYAKKAENQNTYAAQAQTNVQQESSYDYSNRASTRFAQRDIAGAISDLTEAIRIDPNNPMLYLNRGYIRHVTNDLQGALDDYNRALQIKGNFAYAFNNRGVLKVSMNDTQGAMDDYARALMIAPKYSDVYYNRGNLKYMLSDYQGALEDYDKAIELNPKDSEAYNNRGVVRKRLNYNVGALSDYSQAIALNPNDSIAYSNRGRLKKLYFDNEGAAIDLDQAIALAENQVFIKNVKPLMSNEHYIAAVPVVKGVTENPPMIKTEPAPAEKLTHNPNDDAYIPYSGSPSKTIRPVEPQRVASASAQTTANVQRQPEQTTKVAMSTTATQKPAPQAAKPAVANVQPQQQTKTANVPANTLKAGVGVTKSEPVPDIRTSSVAKAPTTNVKLAESYYIRGLQKCVLRDLEGAVKDLDKAIANNSKYADALFYRAAIKKELGDIDGFRKDYAEAIQIDPNLQHNYNDSDALTIIHG